MALKNAFADLALEETQNEILLEQITLQRELMEKVLLELTKLNMYMAEIVGEEISDHDVDTTHEE